jgi:hypothetical protein
MNRNGHGVGINRVGKMMMRQRLGARDRASNRALERTAGSHALAAAAHRER